MPDPSTGRKSKTILRSNIARITDFVWSPNSRLIAGCCSDGCVIIWNASSGSIHTVLEGDSPATCCTFDYVGKLLAVGTFMGSTVLYNLETRDLLCELCSNASSVRSVMFSQDTTRLTTVCSRQAIVWDVSSTNKVRSIQMCGQLAPSKCFLVPLLGSHFSMRPPMNPVLNPIHPPS